MDADPPGWASRLAWAVVGERLDDSAGPGDDDPVTAAAALLARHGWERERIRAHVAGCRVAETPWPHPLPPGWVAAGEHARVAAQVGALVERLGVRKSRFGGNGPLTARDRSLQADRPPHW